MTMLFRRVGGSHEKNSFQFQRKCLHIRQFDGAKSHRKYRRNNRMDAIYFSPLRLGSAMRDWYLVRSGVDDAQKGCDEGRGEAAMKGGRNHRPIETSITTIGDRGAQSAIIFRLSTDRQQKRTKIIISVNPFPKINT